MIVNVLDQKNSILNKFISEIRDTEIQKDSMRFRRNIERIGEILAYEISQTLVFQNKIIATPLGTKIVSIPQKDIVVCSILRAGLPLHNGLLNYFDDAETPSFLPIENTSRKQNLKLKWNILLRLI